MASSDSFSLYADIEAQDDVVREAMSKDANSAETKFAVAKLKQLQKEYYEETGVEHRMCGIYYKKEDNCNKWYTQNEGFATRNFPITASQALLEGEMNYVSGFKPEVAWGSTEIAEPIQPHTESVMYPARKWSWSHRDLPIRINMWRNIVDWDYESSPHGLRTFEYLWQESHSAHSNKSDAERELFQIRDLHAGIYENLLAIPVVKGRKTEKAKLAGVEFTISVDAFVAVNGRGVEVGTCHHLGQGYSKMLNISYEGKENSSKFTSRAIAIMVMLHGDDLGLVLPPRVAPIQACNSAVTALQNVSIRAQTDLSDNFVSRKFNHWELKGVPMRMEIHYKEICAGNVIIAVRYNGTKETMKLDDIARTLPPMLEKIQTSMIEKVRAVRDDHMKLETSSFETFRGHLDRKCMVMSPFCGQPACEDRIQRDSASDDVEEAGAALMGAKTLCIPQDQPDEPLPSKCIHPACSLVPTTYALFGRSY